MDYAAEARKFGGTPVQQKNTDLLESAKKFGGTPVAPAQKPSPMAEAKSAFEQPFKRTSPLQDIEQLSHGDSALRRFASGMASDVVEGAKGFAGDVVKAGKGIVSDIEKEISSSKSIGDASLLDTAQSGFNVAGAAAKGINEVFGSALNNLGITDAMKAQMQNMGLALDTINPDMKKGIIALAGGAAETYDEFAKNNPSVAKNIDNVWQIVQAVPILEGTGKLIKTIPELASKTAAPVIEGVQKSATQLAKGTEEAIGTIKQIPEKAISAATDFATPIDDNVRNALTNPLRSKDIAQTIKDNFEIAKKSKAVTGESTPFEVQGEKQFGGAMEDISKKMTEAGKAKNAALAEHAQDPVIVQSAYDNVGKMMEERLGTAFDAEGGLVDAPGRISIVAGDKSDEAMLKMVRDSINILKRKPSLQIVNDVVDKLQGALYKSNKPGAIPLNGATEGLVKQFTRELNDAAKEVGGEAYKKANADYARLISLQEDLNTALGHNMKNSGSLFKQIFSPAGKNIKDIITRLEEETGRNIFENATLAKFAMDAVGDPRATSLLAEIQGIPTTSKGAVTKLLDYLGNKLASPEAKQAKALRIEAEPRVTPAPKKLNLLNKGIQAVKEGKIPGAMSIQDVSKVPGFTPVMKDNTGAFVSKATHLSPRQPGLPALHKEDYAALTDFIDLASGKLKTTPRLDARIETDAVRVLKDIFGKQVGEDTSTQKIANMAKSFVDRYRSFDGPLPKANAVAAPLKSADPLLVQASKYKTADEFVKAQVTSNSWSEAQKANPNLWNRGILRKSFKPIDAEGAIPKDVHLVQAKWQNYGQNSDIPADVIYERVNSGSFKGEYIDKQGNPAVDANGSILRDIYDEATGRYEVPTITNKQLKDSLLDSFSTKEGKDYLDKVIKALPKNSDGTITAYRIGSIGEGAQSYTLSEGMAKTFSNQGTDIPIPGTPGLPKGGYKDFGVLPVNMVKINPKGIKAWSPYDAEILVESPYVKTKSQLIDIWNKAHAKN